jgi:hypothetical protein
MSDSTSADPAIPTGSLNALPSELDTAPGDPKDFLASRLAITGSDLDSKNGGVL